MADTVRAALVQTSWTGDKESMIKAHEEYSRQAAAQGAKVICFQELFYGPYFCQVQDKEYYSYAESIPGPTTERFQALAAELGMVMILPMYEQEQPGVLYNTAAVVDADGSYLGKYRKTHIPQVKGFWEKFYFRPGNLGYPTFDTAVGRIGVYICYDRHFPEGWRALGPGRRDDRVQPVRDAPRPLVATCGSWSSRPARSPTNTSSARSTAPASRTSATTTSTARPTSSTRRASSSARSATRTTRS